MCIGTTHYFFFLPSDDILPKKSVIIIIIPLRIHTYKMSDNNNKLDIPKSLMDGLDIVAKSANNDPLLLHKVCRNKNVTLEIVQLLLKDNPAAANTPTGEFAWEEYEDSTAYPIHLACRNKHCPSSVIKLLVELNPNHLRHFCVLDEWNPHRQHFQECPPYGLPLHYYLSRTDNIDIETVRMLIKAYPQALIDLDEENDDNIDRYLPIHTLLNNPNVSQMADIVNLLFSVYPGHLIKQHAAYGAYPLHIACENKNMDAKIVQILLELSDSAQVDYDIEPHLPIHSLCANREIDDEAALDILQLLLKQYPGWVQIEAGGGGGLPLHCAAGDGNRSPEFCKILIDAYPESVRVGMESFVYDIGSLPLHEACRGGRLETVKYLFDMYPGGMTTVNDGGYFPIHYAALGHHRFGLIGTVDNQSDTRSYVSEIIKFVLSKDPNGASRVTTDQNRRYPLHIACDSYNGKPDIGVVQALYDSYPQAINLSIVVINGDGDSDSHTPLSLARGHHIRYRGLPRPPIYTTIVTKFLDAQLAYYQKAQDNELLSTFDDNGRLPFHQALQDKAPLGSIKLLVNGNAAALQVADKGGMLPLHIACEYETVNVVKYLAEPFDGHLSIGDKKKNYPLHHACRGGNLEVIKYLLDKQSSAAVSERNNNDKLPVHLLLESDKVDSESLRYTETIWKLLLAYPAAVVV